MSVKSLAHSAQDKALHFAQAVGNELKGHIKHTWSPLERTKGATGTKALLKDIFTNSENLKKAVFRVMDVALAILFAVNVVTVVTLATVKFPVVVGSLILGTSVAASAGLLAAAFTAQFAKLVEKVIEKLNAKKAKKSPAE